VGFVYDGSGRVGLDPDRQVQETIHSFFQTFRRTGSASATVKAFRDQQLPFPRRARYGAHQGETLWGRLEHSRVLWVVHNPRYAGAFFFGRSRQRHTTEARVVSERLPREEWTALIPNAHVRVPHLGGMGQPFQGGIVRHTSDMATTSAPSTSASGPAGC
jgi:hypothetical protein